jgi:acetyltransferase-like isoleucine patch superfamily enzyme
MSKKLEKVFFFSILKILYYISMKYATRLQLYFYKKHGMKIKGTPRYISALTMLDGTDYSLIALGDGVTISSNIRILTHDWAVDTVYHAFASCDEAKRPIGNLREVIIGDYTFIGTNSVIMPGANIGKGVIIGAGSIVRGEIPDYSIVIGNPAKIIGDSREYCKKTFDKIGCDYKELG